MILCLLLLYFDQVVDRLFGLLIFHDCFTCFHTHASHLTFYVSFLILFHSCCSYVQVFRKTLMHEFPITYSHTEWYLLFFAKYGDLSGQRIRKNLTLIIGDLSTSYGWQQPHGDSRAELHQVIGTYFFEKRVEEENSRNGMKNSWHCCSFFYFISFITA